jgi:hypothetical protein
MGRTLGSVDIGGCRLTWERAGATLTDALRRRSISLTPSSGGLEKDVLASDPDQAVLASRESALLADGGRFTLEEAFHGEKIFGAFVIRDRALLFGRDEVGLYEFGNGNAVTFVKPGGGSRFAMALSNGRAAAVPFDQRLVIVNGDGRNGVHLMRAHFPLLRAVGSRFLAGGGSLLTLADGDDPGRAESVETRGQIQPDLARVRGDLAAVPTRDWIYIVDGLGGRIHEKRPDGKIVDVTVAAGKVHVVCANNVTHSFDRDGEQG